MKTLTKIAVLLLALLMVVPMLAACDEGTTTTTPSGDNGEVEVVDMKRYVYKAFVRNESGNTAFKTEDFWYDEATSGQDALSYAVIQRNKEIESTYNCQIKQELSTLESQFEEMRTYFEGDTKFELAIMVTADAASSAIAGFLSDMYSPEYAQYIDFNDETFDQNAIAQLTLGNNLYFITGDMNISSMDNTASTIFNKDLFEESAEGIVEELGDDMYGDLYQMVQDGKWTIDNMLKIAKTMDNDANPNDGAPSYDKGDTIGYYQYQATGLYYFYGAGMRITTENAGGYPSFTINEPEAEEVYNYLFDRLNIGLNTNIPNGASGERSKNFQSGQVLFADYILWDVRRVLYSASIDFVYGILPIPTIEEGASHHSVIQIANTHHIWTLPFKKTNNEYAARMLHIMANYSGKEDSTMDAYYVKTMYMEVARDEGSRASLDIIRGSLVYDLATIYCENKMCGSFTAMLNGIDTDTVRTYGTYTSDSAMLDAQNDLQETMDQFQNYSEGNK